MTSKGLLTSPLLSFNLGDKLDSSNQSLLVVCVPSIIAHNHRAHMGLILHVTNLR